MIGAINPIWLPYLGLAAVVLCIMAGAFLAIPAIFGPSKAFVVLDILLGSIGLKKRGG